jgi:hypothetical protein
MIGDVALRDGQRVGRNIRCVDIGVRIVMREQHRQAARPGA